MDKEVLANVQVEGQVLDKEGNLQPDIIEPSTEEKETPSDSPTEEKTEEEEVESSATPSGEVEPEKVETSEDTTVKGDEEKEPPFHEHPRWKEMFSELEGLREFKEQVLPLINSLDKSKPEEETEEIPVWFSQMFGADESGWKHFRDYDKRQRTALKQDILQEIDNKDKERVKEQTKYNEWTEDELSKLGADKKINLSEGTKDNPNQLRNKLLKVMLEYRPTDEAGNFDFNRGYEIMNALGTVKKTTKKAPETNQKTKKDVASGTVEEKGGEVEEQDFQTPETLRGKSMHDLVHE